MVPRIVGGIYFEGAGICRPGSRPGNCYCNGASSFDSSGSVYGRAFRVGVDKNHSNLCRLNFVMYGGSDARTFEASSLGGGVFGFDESILIRCGITSLAASCCGCCGINGVVGCGGEVCVTGCGRRASGSSEALDGNGALRRTIGSVAVGLHGGTIGTCCGSCAAIGTIDRGNPCFGVTDLRVANATS